MSRLTTCITPFAALAAFATLLLLILHYHDPASPLGLSLIRKPGGLGRYLSPAAGERSGNDETLTLTQTIHITKTITKTRTVTRTKVGPLQHLQTATRSADFRAAPLPAAASRSSDSDDGDGGDVDHPKGTDA